MNIAVLGTGMVGQAIAGRLHELGHSVVVGTRDPQATLARTEPDAMGNPPFSAWHAEPPGRRRSRPSPTPPPAPSWSSTPPRAAPPRRCSAWPAPTTSPARCCSTSPTRSTSPHGFPPTLFVKDTDSLGEQVQRTFPRREGRQDPQHADRRPDGRPEVARRELDDLRLRRRRRGQGDRGRRCSRASATTTSSTSATSRPPAAPRCCCRSGCG